LSAFVQHRILVANSRRLSSTITALVQ